MTHTTLSTLARITRLSVLSLLITGCATLNREECLTADWYDIGFEDGLRGYTLTRIANHRKACAEHGVTVDLDAYREGHSAGAREFCRPQNGYQLGRRGQSYPGICPEDLEDAFVAAYREGIDIWGIETRLNTATAELERARSELEATRQQLQEKETQLVTEGVDATTRRALLEETQALAKTQGALENQILTLEKDVVRFKTQLRQAERRSPYYGR